MSIPAPGAIPSFPNFLKQKLAGRFLRRMLIGIAGAGALLWIAVQVQEINDLRGIESSRVTGLSAVSGIRNFPMSRIESKLVAPTMAAAKESDTEPTRIARTSSIRLSVRNFPAARDSVDRIVKAHGGFTEEITVLSPKDSSRSLDATLMIPAPQGDTALEELRSLGRVDEERQQAEDLTAKSGDLSIRLRNARETETRLTGILRTGTARVSDVLAVENEITRVRGEIEQMEAEQKRMDGRVQFLAIDLSVSEESAGRPQWISGQVGLHLKKAMIQGYQSAADGLFYALEFLLTAMPSLLVWALILFWPARWVWRRSRQGTTVNAA